MSKSPAWTRSEGKNPSGGLNEKGRASLRAAGHDIKRPQPEGGARKDSFCARMKGMKAKLTSSETASDPDSRINKSLRKWNCASGGQVWDKPRPKDLGKPEKLSSSDKRSAKAAAKAAGRPYPNLVDNMRAARAGGGRLGMLMEMLEKAKKAVPLGHADDKLGVFHSLDYQRVPRLKELGGLPSPSLAITKPHMVPTSFGNTVMVGKPHLAVPSEENVVHGSDMYSPRFPSLQNNSYYISERDKAAADALSEKLGGPLKAYDNVMMKSIMRLEEENPLVDWHNVRRYLAMPEQFKEGAPSAYLLNEEGRAVPATLENVSSRMTQGRMVGAEPDSHTSSGRIIANVNKPFSSMEDLLKARSRLAEDLPQHYNQADVFNQLLSGYSEGMRPHQGKGEGILRNPRDYLVEAMNARLERGPQAFNEYYQNLSKEQAQIPSILEYAARDVKPDYFEAKPKRGVTFDEFAGAIIPQDEPRAAYLLEDAGIPAKNIHAGDTHNDEDVNRIIHKEFGEHLFERGGRAERAGGGSVVKSLLANLAKQRPEAMKRARSMGFDTRNVYFHGTDQPIENFHPNVYVAKDPTIAEVYARKREYDPVQLDLFKPNPGPNIMPMFARKGAVEQTNRLADYYKVFDPRDLRSIFAEFNPEHAEDTDLLKSGGGTVGANNNPKDLLQAARRQRETGGTIYRQDKSPWTRESDTTPHSEAPTTEKEPESPATPKISKEQYKKGNLKHGDYALARGGFASHRAMFAGGGSASAPYKIAYFPSDVDALAAMMWSEADIMRGHPDAINAAVSTGWSAKNRALAKFPEGMPESYKKTHDLGSIKDQITNPGMPDKHGHYYGAYSYFNNTRADMAKKAFERNPDLKAYYYDLATRIANGTLEDPTGGSLSYVNPMLASPGWTRSKDWYKTTVDEKAKNGYHQYYGNNNYTPKALAAQKVEADALARAGTPRTKPQAFTPKNPPPVVQPDEKSQNAFFAKYLYGTDAETPPEFEGDVDFDTSLLNRMYNELYGRKAPEAEISYLKDRLGKGEFDMGDLFTYMSKTPEAQKYGDVKLDKLYQDTYGRNASDAEKAYLNKAFAEGTLDRDDLAAYLPTTAEAKTYGNAQLDKIYQDSFNRKPTDAEREYLNQAIANKAFTRSDLAQYLPTTGEGKTWQAAQAWQKEQQAKADEAYAQAYSQYRQAYDRWNLATYQELLAGKGQLPPNWPASPQPPSKEGYTVSIPKYTYTYPEQNLGQQLVGTGAGGNVGAGAAGTTGGGATSPVYSGVTPTYSGGSAPPGYTYKPSTAQDLTSGSSANYYPPSSGGNYASGSLPIGTGTGSTTPTYQPILPSSSLGSAVSGSYNPMAGMPSYLSGLPVWQGPSASYSQGALGNGNPYSAGSSTYYGTGGTGGYTGSGGLGVITITRNAGGRVGRNSGGRLGYSEGGEPSHLDELMSRITDKTVSEMPQGREAVLTAGPEESTWDKISHKLMGDRPSPERRHFVEGIGTLADIGHMGAYATPAAPYVAAADTAHGLATGDRLETLMSAAGLPGRGAKMAGAALGAMSPDEAQASPLGRFIRKGSDILSKDLGMGGVEPRFRSANIKSAKPFSDYEVQGTKVKDYLAPWRPTSIEEHQGKFAAPLLSDLSGAGESIEQIGPNRLTSPFTTHGGGDFTRGPSARGATPAAWASTAPAAKTYQKKLAANVPEGAEVIGIHAGMGKPAADSSDMMVKALLRQMQSAKPSRKAVTDFDKIMEQKIPGWTGVMNEGTEDFLMGLPFSKRHLLAKWMDKAKWQGEGFPDVGETRFAITEPRLMSAPHLTSGYSVAKLNPREGVMKDVEVQHPNYPGHMPTVGDEAYLGGFTSPVHASKIWSNWWDKLSPKAKVKGGEPMAMRGLLTQFPIQKIDQEMVDRVMADQELSKKLFGYRKGGRVKPSRRKPNR